MQYNSGITKILIIGAASAIAQETSKIFAREGASLYLVCRNRERLAALQSDLLVRGARQVDGMAVDLCDLPRHPQIVRCAIDSMKGLDAVLIAHGLLPDQTRCERDINQTLEAFTINTLSVISLLTLLANYFEEQQHGCIAVISSVAGDRGRQSNYVYGASKGAVSIFLDGLRNRLFKSHVSVVTIKPGFVDTPMTAHLPQNALFASAKMVGRRIYDAISRSESVVYVPWFWRPIMTILRHVPEPLFQRLRL